MWEPQGMYSKFLLQQPVILFGENAIMGLKSYPASRVAVIHGSSLNEEYKSKILKLSGLGDEEFFFGPEDMELSFRLKKYGKLIVNLDLKTFHNIVSSSKVSGWLSRSYYEAKGFLILIKKNGNFFYQ